MHRTVPKILLIEGPNVLDLLEGRSERNSLEQICKLFEYDVTSFLIQGKDQLEQTLHYVGSIGSIPEQLSSPNDPVIIHLSTHGNSDGIVIGSDTIYWKSLARYIVRMYSRLFGYPGPVILVLSACETNKQELTKYLRLARKESNIIFPPEYVFFFSDEEIEWKDAVVAWTIFYSKIDNIKFNISSRKDVIAIRKILRQLHESKLGNLTYYRWDASKQIYRGFNPSGNTNHSKASRK